MRRISRFTAAVIASLFLFSMTSAAVASDSNTSFEDVKNYLVEIVR